VLQCAGDRAVDALPFRFVRRRRRRGQQSSYDYVSSINLNVADPVRAARRSGLLQRQIRIS